MSCIWVINSLFHLYLCSTPDAPEWWPEFLLSLQLPTDDEFFFVEPDAKLSKVAPDGWKEDPKKKKSDVPFNLFLRVKFFLDDVNLIQ